METVKEKEGGSYRDKLKVDERRKYTEKLQKINDVDPYDLMLKDWTQDPTLLPPLSFPDIVNYLVLVLSAYTLQEFKGYKSLEAYQLFCSGFVQELKIHTPKDCDSTVVLAEVLHSQRLNEIPLKAWVILRSSGEVDSAHCTCMAGVGETCAHIGALLFKVEAIVLCREMKTVTDQPAHWILPTNVNKVNSSPGYDINDTSAPSSRKSKGRRLAGETDIRPGLKTRSRKVRTPIPAPSQLEMRNFYAALHKADRKAVIFSVLPGYCEEFRDPVQPVPRPKSLLPL